MSSRQFQVLQDHLDSGFRILKYERKFGTYLFSIWEFGQPFIISVEDSEDVNQFIESGSYRKYLLEEVMRCVVLFDIVGFSKLENQLQLQKIIRLQCFLNDPRLKHFDVAEKVALGDGAITTFSETNKLMALDYVKEMSSLMRVFNEKCSGPEKHLLVRTGLNYGKVHRYTDINKVANIIGDGINSAERITSFGEASQILASESIHAMVMEGHKKFQSVFFDCGPYQDKHGLEHRVFNICGNVDGEPIGISRPPKRKG